MHFLSTASERDLCLPLPFHVRQEMTKVLGNETQVCDYNITSPTVKPRHFQVMRCRTLFLVLVPLTYLVKLPAIRNFFPSVTDVSQIFPPTSMLLSRISNRFCLSSSEAPSHAPSALPRLPSHAPASHIPPFAHVPPSRVRT